MSEGLRVVWITEVSGQDSHNDDTSKIDLRTMKVNRRSRLVRDQDLHVTKRKGRETRIVGSTIPSVQNEWPTRVALIAAPRGRQSSKARPNAGDQLQATSWVTRRPT